MSLVTTRKEDVLLELHLNAEVYTPDVSMPFVLIAATYQGKTLFVFNRWREAWELPGGKIEAGEGQHETAIRELAEETGQQALSVTYVGWFKYHLKSSDRILAGAVYRCELESVHPFEANGEISDMRFWDMTSPIDGYVYEIDLYLAKAVHHSLLEDE